MVEADVVVGAWEWFTRCAGSADEAVVNEELVVRVGAVGGEDFLVGRWTLC